LTEKMSRPVFNLINCYEELRYNAIQNNFHRSNSRSLLEKEGMLNWINEVSFLNEETFEVIGPYLTTHCQKSSRGIQNKLSNILSDVILNIFSTEVAYA